MANLGIFVRKSDRTREVLKILNATEPVTDSDDISRIVTLDSAVGYGDSQVLYKILYRRQDATTCVTEQHQGGSEDRFQPV